MPFDLADRRVLLTGGLGFVGREVGRLLEARDVEFVSIAHPESGLTDSGRVRVLDLADSDAVVAAVEGFDVVIHLAARAGGILFQEQVGSDTFAVNRRMTDNVLRASGRAGVQRVFLASSAVIYRASGALLTEDAPKLSIDDQPSQYAWSKISDEVAARWSPDVETVVGRFGNVYGPGAPIGTAGTTVVHALIDRALRCAPGTEFEVWGDGTATRSFVYVVDVATAILSIVEGADAGSALNVDSGEVATISRLAETIRDQIDPSLRLRFDSSKPGGVPYRVQDVTALFALGFRPSVDLQEGIRRTVAWFRESHGSAGG